MASGRVSAVGILLNVLLEDWLLLLRRMRPTRTIESPKSPSILVSRLSSLGLFTPADGIICTARGTVFRTIKRLNTVFNHLDAAHCLLRDILIEVQIVHSTFVYVWVPVWVVDMQIVSM